MAQICRSDSTFLEWCVSDNFYPVKPTTFADGVAAVALELRPHRGSWRKRLVSRPRIWRNLLQFLPSKTFWQTLNGVSAFSNPQTLVLPTAPRTLRRKLGLRVSTPPKPTARCRPLGSTDSARQSSGLRRYQPARLSHRDLRSNAQTWSDFHLLPFCNRCCGRRVCSGLPVESSLLRSPPAEEPAEFGFLQIRPLTLARDHQDLSIDEVDSSQLILPRAAKFLAMAGSKL